MLVLLVAFRTGAENRHFLIIFKLKNKLERPSALVNTGRNIPVIKNVRLHVCKYSWYIQISLFVYTWLSKTTLRHEYFRFQKIFNLCLITNKSDTRNSDHMLFYLKKSRLRWWCDRECSSVGQWTSCLFIVN